MNNDRLFTGNRFVAIPDILKSRCGIMDISFVYMLYRSVIELRGTEDEPFLTPHIAVGKEALDLSKADWAQERYWIPSFRLNERGIKVHSRILPALYHRGFVWTIELESQSNSTLDVDITWNSNWQDAKHVVHVSRPMRGERVGAVSPLHGGIPFVEFRGIAPVFAVAFCPSEKMDMAISSSANPENTILSPEQDGVIAQFGEQIRCQLSTGIKLEPGQKKTISLYIGIGLEEISAVTSAVDLMRHGTERVLNDLYMWIDDHKLALGDEQLNRIANINSLYNFFYSEAFTLDTEELVLLTSRNSGYDKSSSYKDRDAMMWSLPAVLQIEPVQARRMLVHALTVQLRNVGIQSKFIDGVILEPGFALDELCAPIRGLSMYVRATGDMSILFDRRVQMGVNRIHKILQSKKNKSVALFETMLQPSDDVAMYPYITYNNVLVWRVLRDLEWMYELIHDLDRSDDNNQLARQVQKAVMGNCVVEGPFGPMFAWAVDLKGNYQISDDPYGSLQLLSWLEFCQPSLPAYRNTVKWIHSPENPYSFHSAEFSAPGSESVNHPSIASVANDLLAGRSAQAIDFLKRAEMDGGIACESVDENTGKTATGRSFASCAGYLAFALAATLGEKAHGPELEPSERLYVPPPQEIVDSIDAETMM
ncbi:MAG: glycoside hydrolase family 125 protein [Armatimonadota bacterium]